MTHRNKQGPGPYPNQPSANEKTRSGSSVFPGTPYSANNLAVQRSLIEIFDEFTQVISGELKSMNLETFEAERKRPPNAD